MGRQQAIILFSLGISFLILLALARVPACSDPAGCSWFSPGASLLIGMERISSGPDREAALGAMQGAMLAAGEIIEMEGHPIQIQPFDNSCLPGSSDLASGGIAAAQGV